MVHWDFLSPYPKGHLDWFSYFCMAHGCDQQKDRHADWLTHRPQTSVTIHREKWRHRIYGQDTIAILWVCVELSGEDLSCYSNMNWIGLVYENVLMINDLPTNHTSKWSNITVTKDYCHFTYKMAAKNDDHRYRNKITTWYEMLF